MKQKIIKGLATASLCITLVLSIIGITPKTKAASIVEAENFYNEYYFVFYPMIMGEEPPQFSEMLDICSNANPSYGPQTVINTVYVEMLEFLVYNSNVIMNYYYSFGFDEGKNDCLANHSYIYMEGYEEGQNDCLANHSYIYMEGYEEGQNDCLASHSSIKANSYLEGYNQGKHDSAIKYELDILEKYNEGMELGYNQGLANGISEGISIGYSRYEEEKGSIYDLKDLIFSIINAPFNIIKGALNFEIFGVNVSGLVLFLISCGLVIFVLKIFL